MSTQIKRLQQNGTEFVPITLAEAVVVNATNIAGLQTLGITTLEKVLKQTIGIVGTNATDINKLEKSVETINTELAKKLGTLTAGTGITISPEGVISTDLKGFQYKIVIDLPAASADAENIIYLKPSPTAGVNNTFAEFICVKKNESYVWEQLGTLASDVDLSDYVKLEDFNNFKAIALTAVDVTLSSGTKVTIDWDIPTTLYD